MCGLQTSTSVPLPRAARIIQTGTRCRRGRHRIAGGHAPLVSGAGAPWGAVPPPRPEATCISAPGQRGIEPAAYLRDWLGPSSGSADPRGRRGTGQPWSSVGLGACRLGRTLRGIRICVRCGPLVLRNQRLASPAGSRTGAAGGSVRLHSCRRRPIRGEEACRESSFRVWRSRLLRRLRRCCRCRAPGFREAGT